MGILSSMFTALKGGVSEVGEAVVDANAVRILEQEIREADDAIIKAKQSLTNLKATEIKMKRDIQTLQRDLADYEEKALQALNSGQEDLAAEVAERMAEIETDLEDQTAEYTKLEAEVKGLNSLIAKRAKVIKKNKRELEKVKTVTQLQKTTSSISNNFAATNSSEHRVSKALARVKAKQENWRDKMDAGEWMEEQETGNDLDGRLKAAGIGGTNASGSSVLERLKAKQKSAE